MSEATGGRGADPGVVRLYDTTLRDGTQREGLTLTVEDKLLLLRRLDAFGVTFVEGGWPGSNPKDAEFFARARDARLATATLTAFGATRRAGAPPAHDPNLAALLEAGTSTCTLFGKSSTLHVHEVLRVGLDENLRMIEESVRFLVGEGRRVVYDAEHFFDGHALDSAYALETLRAALAGGAEVLVLCETNGGALPWQVTAAVEAVRGALDAPLGIHAHDDSGCAVANSLAAVRAGVRHVQGTINGYGERCGNANLVTLAANLELKLGLRCVPDGRLTELTELSRLVAEVANLAPNEHAPYVGASAFAHKGGVHVAAMRRSAASYQHVTPEAVGNRSRVVVSELSGRGNVLSKAEELGVEVAAGAESAVLEHIKEAEARGFSYEGAEASVELLLRRRRPGWLPRFEIVDFSATVGRRAGTETFAEAVVKVRVGDRTLHTVADGNGPVSALDAALRKALEPVYPEVSRIHLADYKVRILDGALGTGAVTRVLVTSAAGERSWSTVGASANLIEASLSAVVDGLEYGLAVASDRPAPSLESP
ncbi:MAG: citramalate synthase [Polyangiaceae bacterium]|nr:citramalate synthase [Polyangiaceae bacterium]